MSRETRVISLEDISIPERARQIDLESDSFYGLLNSIKQKGLLQPILVAEADDEQFKLICGERRYLCHQKLELPTIMAVVCPALTPEDELFFELDENRAREDFTWAETLLLKGKLWIQYRKGDPKFRRKEFSALLGQSEALTSMELTLFQAANKYPEILTCPSMSAAVEFLKELKLNALLKESNSREIQRYNKKKDAENSDSEDCGSEDYDELRKCLKSPKGERFGGKVLSATNTVSNPTQFEEDNLAQEILKSVKAQVTSTTRLRDTYAYTVWDSMSDLFKETNESSVDCIVTDPPFGIEANMSRVRNKRDVYDGKYKDSEEDWKDLMISFICESARTLKPGAHLYMFCSFKHYTWLELALHQMSFTLAPTPIIWGKTSKEGKIWPLSCNLPQYYPAHSCQLIIMAFNEGKKRELVMRGKPNLFLYPAKEAGEQKGHSFEVPVAVYSRLISLSCNPGDVVLDPFCGTGNSLLAGIINDVNMSGAEIAPGYRDLATYKINQTLKRKE